MSTENAFFRPQGALTFANATTVLRAGEAFLRQQDAEKTLIFDFSAVTRVDSSVLALACAWRRLAQVNTQQIQWQALPDALQSLAAVYGLEDFFVVTAS